MDGSAFDGIISNLTDAFGGIGICVAVGLLCVRELYSAMKPVLVDKLTHTINHSPHKTSEMHETILTVLASMNDSMSMYVSALYSVADDMKSATVNTVAGQMKSTDPPHLIDGNLVKMASQSQTLYIEGDDLLNISGDFGDWLKTNRVRSMWVDRIPHHGKLALEYKTFILITTSLRESCPHTPTARIITSLLYGLGGL